MMNRFLFLISFCISLLLNLDSYSQGGEGNIWYFGDNAGLDFNSGSPVALTNGSLDTQEGCATICDSLGNLLFYTDGVYVFDASHNWTVNSQIGSPGGPLKGDPSSTQSGIIVPKPQDPDIYYIFTVDNNIGPNGLRYSVFDMSLNNGLGDVVPGQKNILLFSPSNEKIHAVKHANGEDIWVITHPWNSGSYFTYLITSSGLNPTPVISSCGSLITGSSSVARGYLKSSHDGTLVCAAHEGLNKFELFNFDNSTGLLSILLSSLSLYSDPYGVEFSPNDQYMYLSLRWSSQLYQFDVSMLTPAMILSSQTQIATLYSTYGGALQLAPDNKIYLARNSTLYLGVINNPDQNGILCNYVDQGVYLSGNVSREGLPSYITTTYNTTHISFIGQCVGDTVHFEASNLYSPDSVLWQIYNNQSLLVATSEDISPDFVFLNNGNYNINLYIYQSNTVDSAYKEMLLFAAPDFNLPVDTAFCSGIPIDIILPPADVDYIWSTGPNSNYITIEMEGVYSVTGSNYCGVLIDSINVIENFPLVNNLFPDTTFCEGSPLVLDAGNTGADYVWSTGSISQSINVIESGGYFVTMTNACDTMYHAILATMLDTELNLGPDTVICEGEEIILGEEHLYSDILWSTGDTTHSIIVDTEGIYALAMTNFCGVFLDEIEVVVNLLPVISFPYDTVAISWENDSVILDPGVTGISYLWSTGEITPTIEIFSSFTGPGIYSVTITNEYGCQGYGDIFVSFYTEIDNIDKIRDIQLFPNPATEILNIKLNSISNQKIQIYNTIGMLVSELPVNEPIIKISISEFPEGIYYLKVISETNEQFLKPFSIVR